MKPVFQKVWPTDLDSADAVAAYARATGISPAIEWQMNPGEQAALIALLHGLQPKVAIEIGSWLGGSLQVLSRYAKRVFSIDIDPTCQERLGHLFPNAEFVTGDSKHAIPLLMGRLEEERAEVGIILIDGDHTIQGVQDDIRGLLGYRPSCPLFVLIHDSFNPSVREGIRTAAWSESNYVHSVELDYVPGVLMSGGAEHGEMWGGLCLSIFLPNQRLRPLAVHSRLESVFQMTYRHSVHKSSSVASLIKRMKHLFAKVPRRR